VVVGIVLVTPVMMQFEEGFHVAAGIAPPFLACSYVPPFNTVSNPEYGVAAVLDIFNVPRFDMSHGAVNTRIPGIVSTHVFVPSPIITFEPAPDTVQFTPMEGTALFRILKI
jgi:hypothetical protein